MPAWITQVRHLINNRIPMIKDTCIIIHNACMSILYYIMEYNSVYRPWILSFSYAIVMYWKQEKVNVGDVPSLKRERYS